MARGDGFLVWQGARLRRRLVSAFGHLAVQPRQQRKNDTGGHHIRGNEHDPKDFVPLLRGKARIDLAEHAGKFQT